MWFVGFGFSDYTAQLAFFDDSLRRLHQRAASVSVGRSVGERWLLRVSASALLTGELRGQEAAEATGKTDPPLADIGLGGSLAASMSRTYTFDGLDGFFLGAAYSCSVAVAEVTYRTESTSRPLVAVDLRVGGMVGWTLWQKVTPYIAGRLYGGPVFWATRPGGKQETGSDRYHALLAAGLSVRTPTGLYISAEAAPGGEQVLSIEVGARL